MQTADCRGKSRRRVEPLFEFNDGQRFFLLTNNFRKMFGKSSAGFDRLLEKATSQLLLEPDWTSTMMICDSIRQGDTNPK